MYQADAYAAASERVEIARCSVRALPRCVPLTSARTCRPTSASPRSPVASSAGGTTGGGAAGQHFDAIHLRLLRRSIADLVGVGDRFRLALRTSLIFSGIIFLSLAITVGGDARFLWRTMGTRPGCDTWVHQRPNGHLRAPFICLYGTGVSKRTAPLSSSWSIFCIVCEQAEQPRGRSSTRDDLLHRL